MGNAFIAGRGGGSSSYDVIEAYAGTAEFTVANHRQHSVNSPISELNITLPTIQTSAAMERAMRICGVDFTTSSSADFTFSCSPSPIWVGGTPAWAKGAYYEINFKYNYAKSAWVAVWAEVS